MDNEEPNSSTRITALFNIANTYSSNCKLNYINSILCGYEPSIIVLFVYISDENIAGYYARR